MRVGQASYMGREVNWSRGIIVPKPWGFAGFWAFTLVNWSHDKTLNPQKPPSITRGKNTENAR
jgi:hypothetical protein